jgi:hypothetical protein
MYILSLVQRHVHQLVNSKSFYWGKSLIKQTIRDALDKELRDLQENELFKHERVLGSPQRALVSSDDQTAAPKKHGL